MIDIIIPAYNAHATLERALCSVEMQTVKATVTVVNDCGDGYADLHLHHQFNEICTPKNGGPGVARQYGIDHTHGEYIVFLDADDTFVCSTALEILLKGIEGYNVCVGQFVEQTPKGFLNHSRDMVWMHGKMYRRQFLDDWEIRFNDTRANEDAGFNGIIKLIVEEEEVHFVDDVVYLWQTRPDSITRINNCEYTHGDGMVGMVDNMIYSIKEAKKRRPLKSFAEYVCICLFNIYKEVNAVYREAPENIKRALESAERFYREIVYYELIPEEIYPIIWRKHGFEIKYLPHYSFDDFISLCKGAA